MTNPNSRIIPKIPLPVISEQTPIFVRENNSVENTILDRFDDKQPSATNYGKYYVTLALLSAATALALYFNPQRITERVYFIILLFLFFLPVTSMILGLIIALFLRKSRTFLRRFFHGSIVSAIAILALILITRLMAIL